MSMFAYDKLLESQASEGQILKVLFMNTCDLLDNNKIRLCMFPGLTFGGRVCKIQMWNGAMNFVFYGFVILKVLVNLYELVISSVAISWGWPLHRGLTVPISTRISDITSLLVALRPRRALSFYEVELNNSSKKQKDLCTTPSWSYDERSKMMQW